MCQDKAHGGNRCPQDNSDARRRRRKAQDARTVHTARTVDQGELVQPSPSLETMDDIKQEAAVLSELLQSSLQSDRASQEVVDARLERRVTQLGLAIGAEIDRRAGVSVETLKEELSNVSSPTLDERNKLGEAREEAWHETRKVVRNTEKAIREKFPESFVDVPEWKHLTDKNASERIRPNELLVPEGVDRNSDEFKAWERAVEADDIAFEAVDSDWEQSVSEVMDLKKAVKKKAVQKLIDTSRSVLSEIRPLGGKIPVVYTNDESVMKVMGETVGRDYPTAWIENSANAGPLAIISQKGRAIYAHHQTYESSNRNDKAANLQKVTFRGQDMSDAEKLRDQPDVYVSSGNQPSETSEGEMVSFLVNEQQVFDPSKAPTDEEGKPLSKQWKYGYVVQQVEGEEYATISSEKQWYRCPKQRNMIIFPTISVDLKAEVESASYHEFAHRVEETSQNRVFTRLEEAFLRRRTTDENGKRSEMINVTRSVNPEVFPDTEFGRDGGFVTAYVGREYLYSDSREVLSMGIESIFSNRYGCLIGLNMYKKDLDHRGFTLGMLATA